MARLTPAELAAWAERAGPDEQYEVLDTLYGLIQNDGDEDELSFLSGKQPFLAMLDCGAFESAAISLVPDTHYLSLDTKLGGAAVVLFPKERERRCATHGKAQTPALAIAAAIARTMED